MAAGLFHRAITQSGVITTPGIIESHPWPLAQVCISFPLLPYVCLPYPTLCWPWGLRVVGVAGRELPVSKEEPNKMKEHQRKQLLHSSMLAVREGFLKEATLKHIIVGPFSRVGEHPSLPQAAWWRGSPLPATCCLRALHSGSRSPPYILIVRPCEENPGEGSHSGNCICKGCRCGRQ